MSRRESEECQNCRKSKPWSANCGRAGQASIAQGARGELPLRRRWLPEWTAALQGRRVREVCRRGKWIQIVFDEQLILVVHLGMTGQLKVVPAAAPWNCILILSST